MDGEGLHSGGRSLAILVPVLRRPHRVAPLLASAKATTPSARVLFLASPGDDAEHDAVRAAGGDLLVCDPHAPGDYARKINAGYRATTEDLLFLGADDIDFHPGWFEAAAALMGGPVGVVGTNDLGNARVMSGEHATHSLVSRSYIDTHGTIDRRGQVLHEGYPHEFVDDEFVATAKRRGAWAFAPDAVVEHLHPLWGKAPTDALYDAHPLRMRQGRRVFVRRQHLWA